MTENRKLVLPFETFSHWELPKELSDHSTKGLFLTNFCLRSMWVHFGLIIQEINSNVRNIRPNITALKV